VHVSVVIELSVGCHCRHLSWLAVTCLVIILMMVVDPSVLQATLVGHTDAIWGLSMHNSKMQLLSCSSDATVRLWNPNVKSPLLSTFRIDTGTLLHCLLSVSAAIFAKQC